MSNLDDIEKQKQELLAQQKASLNRSKQIGRSCEPIADSILENLDKQNTQLETIAGKNEKLANQLDKADEDLASMRSCFMCCWKPNRSKKVQKKIKQINKKIDDIQDSKIIADDKEKKEEESKKMVVDRKKIGAAVQNEQQEEGKYGRYDDVIDDLDDISNIVGGLKTRAEHIGTGLAYSHALISKITTRTEENTTRTQKNAIDCTKI